MTAPQIGPNGLPFWEKDPSAVKDYSIDWTAWLDGGTVAQSEWTVPAGLTKGDELNTGTFATVWLSGGTAGRRYRVTNRITTASTPPRVEEQSFEIVVKHQ